MSEEQNTDESKHCLNCGTELTDKYCSHCGQRDLPARQDLKDMLINFVSSFYSFESKFFKTFQYLLFKPGKIVEEYNAGKRESYYHPARMYVFLSFIFFLLFSIVASTDGINFDDKDKVKTKADSIRQDSIKALVKKQLKAAGVSDEENDSADSDEVDSTQTGAKNGPNVRVWTDSASTKDAKTVEEYDSIQNTLPEDRRDNFVTKYFARKGIMVASKAKEDQKEFAKSFLNDMIENTPRMIFFLMPLFALILKLLYVRRGHYYSEHLVFTVFLYDFIYLVGSLIMLIGMIGIDWLGWIQGALYIWIFIYLYKSMRRVYKQRRGRTILKFLILIAVFSVFVILGIAGLGVVALANV